MLDCFDFNCEEYNEEDEVIKAITLLSDTKINPRFLCNRLLLS